ncbi:hypothetical protein HDV00_009103, partial [Rhizophlyctis rosea]
HRTNVPHHETYLLTKPHLSTKTEILINTKNMIPPLPTELYPFVARVCEPLTAQRLRNATRATRKVITKHDLLVAEAGGTSPGVSTRAGNGLEVTYETLSEKVRTAITTQDEKFLINLVHLIVSKYVPEPIDNNFPYSVIADAIALTAPNVRPQVKLAMAIGSYLHTIDEAYKNPQHIVPVWRAIEDNWDGGGRAIFDYAAMNLPGNVHKKAVIVRVGCMVLGHFWEGAVQNS